MSSIMFCAKLCVTDRALVRPLWHQVLQMESAVLMRLNFRLATATSKKFLYRYVKAAGFTEREAELVHVRGCNLFLCP
jgi:hypothetical protein